MIIEIATDGAAQPNPGPGGWACVFRANGAAKALYGSEPDTTNNRMELMGAIKALEHLKRPCEIVLTSDSQYLIKGASAWIKDWKRKNFRGVKNPDLWKRLDEATKRHTITWKWCKGHDIHTDNNLCDNLANQAAFNQTSGEVDLNKFSIASC